MLYVIKWNLQRPFHEWIWFLFGGGSNPRATIAHFWLYAGHFWLLVGSARVSEVSRTGMGALLRWCHSGGHRWAPSPRHSSCSTSPAWPGCACHRYTFEELRCVAGSGGRQCVCYTGLRGLRHPSISCTFPDTDCMVHMVHPTKVSLSSYC